MKDPAILFYTGDFLAGTLTMTDDQVGKYIRLLCLQHQKGRLSEKDMLFICKSYDEDIFSKFQKNGDGRYYNERMEIEINKRIKYSESRSKNRKKPINEEDEINNNEKKEDEKDDHMNNTCISCDNHMGNENRNIIIDKDLIKEKGVKGKKQEEKKYADFVSMTENNYQTLVAKHGTEMTNKLIEILDNYKASSGKRYKDDYRAILSWVIDTYYEKHAKKKSGLNVRTPLFK